MAEPLALIIGDSISMGYTPHVQQMLSGAIRVERHEGNGGTSSNVRARLDEWFAALEPPVVHFNAGLHDLARDEGEDGPNRVPIEQYGENLRAIVAWLRENTRAELIWAITTPVVDEWHAARKGFIRRQSDVVTYNRVAMEVMEREGVQVNDLHTVVEEAGCASCLKPDGVHMRDEASRRLAEAVAASILKALSTASQKSR